MKKPAIFLFFALLSVFAYGQSIQEGQSHLFSGRTASAKTTFNQLIAANPNNIDAIYWLGQTELEAGRVAAARRIYQDALTANGNAPIILVGLGHVLLAEGKAEEARGQFEMAISLSRKRKKDNPDILNAIGRAHVEVKNGDLPYAIAKLSQAAEIAPSNSDIFVNLGNAYRKARDGNMAAANYMAATRADNKNPVPFYRLALLYKTQRNWDIVEENLNRAIAIDPKFAPAYLQLYDYYLRIKQDFTRAGELANQFIANADASVQNDYLKAQTLFVQRNYDQAIALGKNIIDKAGDEIPSRVYRLIAYSYLEKKDTTAARPYVDTFFEVAAEDDLIPMDYLLKAFVYLNQDPAIVRTAIQEGMKADTILGNQINFLNEVIELARTSNLPLVEADARTISYHLRGDQANPAEMFNVGLAYYRAAKFTKADSAFRVYSTAMPDSIYGYLWSARALASIDTTGEKGLAMKDYEELLRTAGQDKPRFKSYGVEAAGNLANYYVNVKGDLDKGIFYLKQGLEFDPENTAFKSAVDRLQKAKAARKSSGSSGKGK